MPSPTMKLVTPLDNDLDDMPLDASGHRSLWIGRKERLSRAFKPSTWLISPDTQVQAHALSPGLSALRSVGGDTTPAEGQGPGAMPQTIAHRGYKAKYPENTMCAFSHAIRVGSHGLETDIHMSRDGVVVLCHDRTLSRCFGVDRRVVDCDWEYLSTLRTIHAPHEPMPTLLELLNFLARPDYADIGVLLDIKLDNDPFKTIKAIHDAIRSEPSPHRPWNERLLLGCWTHDWLAPCETYLPTFPIALITISIQYARLFLGFPAVSTININHKVLMGPCGKKFLDAAHAAHRAVFVWTVNDENSMRWAIDAGVDGVLTDDPELFRRVCDEWEEEAEAEAEVNLKEKAEADGALPLLRPRRRQRSGPAVRIPLQQQVKTLMVAAAVFVISSLLMTIYRGRIRRVVRDRRYYQRDDV